MPSVEEEAAALTLSSIAQEDKELFEFYQQIIPKIFVFGTGGSGSNTIARLSEIGVVGAQLIAANTDVQHLMRIKGAHRKILLGRSTTRGLGAGSDPEIGERAAEEARDEIKAAISGASVVFVTCGLGGGTGTGSAHIIAHCAKDVGALTVGVVTLPFTSEGYQRRANAMAGLEKLKAAVDTLIVIPNDKLLTLVPDLPLDAAFRVCDEVLARACKGIVEMVTMPGLINLDLADLRTILREGGFAMIGLGEATASAPPEQRALIAVETALNSPLLDVDYAESRRALINVVGGEDMTLREAELIAAEVSKRIAPEAHIIWGARIEKGLARNSIQALVVLAGVKEPDFGKPVQQEEGFSISDLDEII